MSKSSDSSSLLVKGETERSLLLLQDGKRYEWQGNVSVLYFSAMLNNMLKISLKAERRFALYRIAIYRLESSVNNNYEGKNVYEKSDTIPLLVISCHSFGTPELKQSVFFVSQTNFL